MKRSRGRKDSGSDEEDEEGGRQVAQGSVFMRQGQSVEFMMVTPDEKLYTCEADGCVRVYDLDVRCPSLPPSHSLCWPLTWIGGDVDQSGELDSQSKPIQARSLRLEPQAIFVNTRANTIIAWSTTVPSSPLLAGIHVLTERLPRYERPLEHQLLHHVQWAQEVDNRLHHRRRRSLHSLCRRHGDVVGRHHGASPLEELRQIFWQRFISTGCSRYTPHSSPASPPLPTHTPPTEGAGVRTGMVYMGRTKNGPVIEQTKKHRNVFKGHKESITSLFYDNGVMYTASTDLTIKSWNPKVRRPFTW